jgi:hypothetical protein
MILAYLNYQLLFDIIFIEDTKRVIRSCNLKKDRQYNGQKKRGQKETL